MGIFDAIFGKKSNSKTNIPNIISSVAKAGGKAVVQIPFDDFIAYAKSSSEILSYSGGVINCRVNLNGEKTKVQFASGELIFNLKDRETLVTVYSKSDFEKNISLSQIEEISTSVSRMINEEIDSKDLAKITVWFMLCQLENYNNEFEEPIFSKKFKINCTENYTMFDEEWADTLEKNIRLDHYMETREHTDALDLFDHAINNLQDNNNQCKLGYSIAQKIVTEWDLLG